MTSKLKQLPLEEISDKNIRQAFEFLRDFIQEDGMLGGQFQHFEKIFTQNETLTIPHSLGFTPRDLIQTYLSGTGTITYNYSLFSDENISVTISGGPSSSSPLTVRFYLGRHD